MRSCLTNLYFHSHSSLLREEVQGHHFYTRIVQRRSLLVGADFADMMGDSGAATFYRQQARAMESVIDKHWDDNRGYINEMLDVPYNVGRSGKNIASILAVIHGYNYLDGFYGPTSDKVLATALKIMQDFQDIFPINKMTNDRDTNLPMGPALGRYRGRKRVES